MSNRQNTSDLPPGRRRMPAVALALCIVGCLPGRGGTVETYAGAGTPGYANAVGREARFHAPEALAVGPDGLLYVSDSGNGTIRQVAPGGIVSTIAGAGRPALAEPRDGVAEGATFRRPGCLAVTPLGSLLVVDAGRTIREITPSRLVTTLRFQEREVAPLAVAVDATGDLVVAEAGAIRRIDRIGTVTDLATGDMVAQPGGLALDPAGNVFCSDALLHRILRIAPDRRIAVLAGSGVSGLLDGPGSRAQFSGPRGLAIDKSGTLYVADAYNHRIRTVSPAGAVKTLAGAGGIGLLDGGAFVDGPVGSAAFRVPTGLALGADGILYVADKRNHCVRIVRPR